MRLENGGVWGSGSDRPRAAAAAHLECGPGALAGASQTAAVDRRGPPWTAVHAVHRRAPPWTAAHPPWTAVDRTERSARYATAGDYIDFAAPGVGIWPAVLGGGKAMSGTSIAAPVVTADVAAAQRKLGLKTVGEIRAHLRKHTKDRGKPGRDRYTGWGLLELRPLC